jgi:hypothetical protein
MLNEHSFEWLLRSDIYPPINPFVSFKDYIDNEENRRFINDFLEKIADQFFKFFPGISSDLLKKTFWDLLEGKTLNPFNWYVKASFFIGRIIFYKILRRNGRISEETYQISYQFFDYLVNRTMPHEIMIDKDFFGKIYSGFPVVNLKEMVFLYREAISMHEEDNLKEVLEDPNVDPIKKIRKFKENFLNGYQRFIGRCQHYGDELSKFEGNKRFGRWGNRISDIFQSPAPPNLIKDVLNTHRHIKNAISHSDSGGIVLINGDREVRITDKTSQGTITFQKDYPLSLLWYIYYSLIIIDKSFEIFALSFALCREAREMNDQCIFIFICDYNHFNEVFMLPNKQYIVMCKECGRIHFSTNLKTTGHLMVGLRGPYAILRPRLKFLVKNRWNTDEY